MEIGINKATGETQLKNLNKKANELSNNSISSGSDKITADELAQLASMALADDGEITKDELEVINSALKNSNGGMQLKSFEFKNSVTFEFKVIKDGNEKNITGTLNTKADITSNSTIGKKEQAYIREKTGIDINMSGWVKDSGEIRKIISGLITSNGFNINAYKNNQGYRDRMVSSIGDLMPGIDAKKFCDVMFGVTPITVSNVNGELISPEIKVLQEGLNKAGLGKLLSQDGSQKVDGKLGLRTATAIDRLFAVINAQGNLNINIPKNTNVVVFTDNSTSMKKFSDQVAGVVDDMKTVAKNKGSTFGVVEGYNNGSGNEKHIQTAIKFIRDGSFTDKNGNAIKFPANGKPTQIVFQTDAHTDTFKQEELQELIKLCNEKKVDLILQNPSTGTKISINEIKSKVCKDGTNDIDTEKFNQYFGPAMITDTRDKIINKNNLKSFFQKELNMLLALDSEKITIKNDRKTFELSIDELISKIATKGPNGYNVNETKLINFLKENGLINSSTPSDKLSISSTKKVFDFNKLSDGKFGIEGR